MKNDKQLKLVCVHFNNIIDKIRNETRDLSFEITEDQYGNIGIQEHSLVKWTTEDLAYIHAIPKLICKGYFIKEIFEITTLADNRIDQYFTILLPEAKDRKVAIRSSLFASVYLSFPYGKTAISKILSGAQSGFLANRFENKDSLRAFEEILSNCPVLSNGQLYYLLTVTRFHQHQKLLYNQIKNSLETKWKYLPYHLKLEILQAVGRFWGDEGKRENLIKVIQELPKSGNIMISSSIRKALSSLGGLDGNALSYEATVIDEIENVLNHENETYYHQLAANLYDRQSDHPYNVAYKNIISSIEPNKSRRFLSMVVQGSSPDLFNSSLIKDLYQLAKKGSFSLFE